MITVRHAESPDLAEVRGRLESTSELLARGPQAILYAIFDEVVEGCGPTLNGLQNDIDEIENRLFDGKPDVSRRIYDLLREVSGFQRAVHPLPEMVKALLHGAEKYRLDVELQHAFRDIGIRISRVTDRADAFRALLQNALTVHSTLVTQHQNEEMKRLTEARLAQNQETQRLSETSLAQNEEVKKISGWAAILFAPHRDRHNLRHELPQHAGTPLAIRLSTGDRRHAKA